MENEIQEKFLPIGSIVLLKGGTKKAMVTGFCSVTQDNTNKVYDYTGCVYPEGYLNFDQICLFDHDQIEKIYHLGYVDEEEQSFKEELNEIARKIESGEETIDNYIEDISDEDDNHIIPDMDEEDDYDEEEEKELEYL